MTADAPKARILLTGATGSIGGRLLPLLLEQGHDVRALVRDPVKANLPDGVDVVKGDVFADQGLREGLQDRDVAYYLIHAMGRGNHGDFAELDRRGAHAFGRAARDAGVARTVYLGGLDGDGAEESHHLQSRQEVADILATYVPEPVHARAAMVIGGDSQSFVILRHLVERLPVMICPKWVDTRSQPIAQADVVKALAELGVGDRTAPEVQLGGNDVLTYRDMMIRMAALLERRRPPMIPVPVMTPRLSSLWVSLVGGVEYPLVRPLVQGLLAEMIVTTPPPEGINTSPMGFDDAVRAAIAEA